MRLTEFWRRMNAHFGETYAESWARDYVLAPLGGRTVVQALAEGESAKSVWRAVCQVENVSSKLR
jgi:D-alanyl-lipoteichoic acid acyltransferase DltB (MBOAT superfamily)